MHDKSAWHRDTMHAIRCKRYQCGYCLYWLTEDQKAQVEIYCMCGETFNQVKERAYQVQTFPARIYLNLQTLREEKEIRETLQCLVPIPFLIQLIRQYRYAWRVQLSQSDVFGMCEYPVVVPSCGPTNSARRLLYF